MTTEDINKQTLQVNGDEYDIESMTREQKTMINHVTDLDQKISIAQFNLNQLQVGREAFVSMLEQSLSTQPSKR
jgi:hypothetical protein